MKATAFGLAAFGAAMGVSSPAHAGVSEVRVGVMAHNICITDCKNAHKEPGPNVEVAVSFDPPGFLSRLGAPEPYLVASINTHGETSFAGGGVEWRVKLSEKWALQPGLGYVIHDGELNNPYANGTPESAAFADEHLLHGSRDLFRTSLGVTRELDGPWETQLFFSHLSHGQILGNGRNQGTDQLGVRIGYRFGE